MLSAARRPSRVLIIVVLLLVGVWSAKAAAQYRPASRAQVPPTWATRRTAVVPFLGDPSSLVSNGDFETGDFTGWTVVDEDTGQVGDWFVYGGTGSPVNGFPVAAPPQGSFAAITDQGGSGSHILYQDVMLPSMGPLSLTLVVHYNNLAGVFFTPASLGSGFSPNQQFRVDIVDPDALVESMAPDDVLANVFRTEVNAPVTLEPTRITFNLTKFAGQRVRLRIAEVDNQSYFEAGVDAIAITVAPGACAGDCDDSGLVTVDDLLTVVNVALGNAGVAACVAGDRDQDEIISVDELLAAVSSALSGCPATPPADPTRTPTPTTGTGASPTPTAARAS